MKINKSKRIENIKITSEREVYLSYRKKFLLPDNRFEVDKRGHIVSLNLGGGWISRMGKYGIVNPLTNIIHLEFDKNSIKLSKIEGLEHFPKLRSLDLMDNNIKKIEGLDTLKLEKLDLSFNKIGKIENLDKLSNLKELYLGYNHIENIEELDRLTKLERLILSSNKIRRIRGLEKLSKLKVLALDNNQISRIENLEQLSQLESLNISDNKITKIENLDHFSKLKRLIIDNNQIEEIKELSKLTQLEELDIRNNKIQIKGYYKIFENYMRGTKDNEIKKILGIGNLTKLDYFNFDYNQFEMSKGVMSILPNDEFEDDFYGPW